ncbi:MAG TPA: hypothetical protein ENK41_01485, partial [Rhodobacteraceae bacterium]|nr:hypothetical protein [Paracoccaceae bacterium]
MAERSVYATAAGYVDWDPIITGDMGSATGAATATLFSLRNDDGSWTWYTGSGFAYDRDGFPTDGVVTGIDHRDPAGTTVLGTLSKLSASLHELAVYVDTADTDGYFSTLFSGDDLITSLDPDDTTFDGMSGNDTITAASGNDTLQGAAGRDNLQGGDGNDILDGGSGNDWMFGGPGDDTYHVDESLDYIDEGIAFPALPGGGSDTLISTAAWYYESNFTIETLIIAESAAAYHTTIVAGGNNNVIHGNSGDNNLYANWGDDTVYAGAGLDHIDLADRGGGATGANTVMFEIGNGYDILWNFAPGTDHVDLKPFGLADYAELL